MKKKEKKEKKPPDFLLKKTYTFDYAVYYNAYCQGFTRQQTKETFIKDLDSSLSKVDCGINEAKWVNQRKEYDCPISLKSISGYI